MIVIHNCWRLRIIEYEYSCEPVYNKCLTDIMSIHIFVQVFIGRLVLFDQPLKGLHRSPWTSQDNWVGSLSLFIICCGQLRGGHHCRTISDNRVHRVLHFFLLLNCCIFAPSLCQGSARSGHQPSSPFILNSTWSSTDPRTTSICCHHCLSNLQGTNTGALQTPLL